METLILILNHMDAILTLLAVLFIACLLIRYIRQNGIAFAQSMLLSMVTQAEKDFGSGTGVLKKSSVITAIYAQLPSLFKLFIPEQTVSFLIEDALLDAKEHWASNDRLNELVSGDDNA